MAQKQRLRPKSRDEFEIGIICALALEADAIFTLFDHHWDEDFGKAYGDPNAYSTGVIGQHNVVLVHLPRTGKVAAANSAAFCRASYPGIRLTLVVGTCGGVPSYGKGTEILLGDVIISTGVVQHDLGKRFTDKFRTKDTTEDSLGRPSLGIRCLLSKLKTRYHQGRLQIATQKHLERVLKETMKLRLRQGLQDHLCPADYRHKHQEPSECKICAACNGNSDPVCEIALSSNCKELKCDAGQRLSRDRLGGIKFDIGNKSLSSNNDTLFPTIHFGTFASGDSLIRSAEYRDQLATSKDVIGFEMESVGVWEMFPTVVIKGVSNYADSHKNDDWQDLAAASAAACTKAFLRYWESTKENTRSEAEEQKPRETAMNNIRFPEAKGRKDDNTPPASPTTNQ
ncbi:hypothetical protein SNK04_004470 [Fusarium graminearum]